MVGLEDLLAVTAVVAAAVVSAVHPDLQEQGNQQRRKKLEHPPRNRAPKKYSRMNLHTGKNVKKMKNYSLSSNGKKEEDKKKERKVELRT